MSASMFASGGKKDNSNAVIYDTTACCTQSANGGEPNSPSYVSVTVTKCFGGKTHNDAKVAACENALTAAQNSVKALTKTTVTIQPTN